MMVMMFLPEKTHFSKEKACFYMGTSYLQIEDHSISDIKVCAISPISGGNDSRKR